LRIPWGRMGQIGLRGPKSPLSAAIRAVQGTGYDGPAAQLREGEKLAFLARRKAISSRGITYVFLKRFSLTQQNTLKQR
jgi:hypothetical protein